MLDHYEYSKIKGQWTKVGVPTLIVDKSGCRADGAFGGRPTKPETLGSRFRHVDRTPTPYAKHYQQLFRASRHVLAPNTTAAHRASAEHPLLSGDVSGCTHIALLMFSYTHFCLGLHPLVSEIDTHFCPNGDRREHPYTSSQPKPANTHEHTRTLPNTRHPRQNISDHAGLLPGDLPRAASNLA